MVSQQVIITTLIELSLMNGVFNLICALSLRDLIALSPWKIFFQYYGTGSILTCVHILGHSKWGGWWRKQHVGNHHIKCYPEKKFTRPPPYYNYLELHEDGNIWLFAIPVVISCFCLASSTLELIALLIYSYTILSREEFLHKTIHTTPNMFENNRYFKVLREVHFEHHRGKMKYNYGFSEPVFDYVFGTLVLPK